MDRARVSGVILAAGPSRRFGDDPPKQLALVEGEPLVRRVVRRSVESDLAEVIVVTGMAAARVERALEDLGVRIVSNPRFREGQSSSVKVGLAAVDRRSAAAMFVPVDQPGLSTSIINTLLECYRQTASAIVVPTYQGRRGAPAVISRSLFGELAAIEGDSGGRQIFSRYEPHIFEFALASEDALRDLDTLEDLERLGG
jgi:molybdenum cofactor cytidylyltransferase